MLDGAAVGGTAPHPLLEAATVSGELVEDVRLLDDRVPAWDQRARAILTCGKSEVATMAR